RPVTESRLQTGVNRVLQNFQRGDHLQAKVTLESLDYHKEENNLTPSLSIEGGPILQVRTVGAKVSKGKLRELVPVFQERTVDRSLLIEGRRNLVEYFQSQGFFDAQVDFDESTPQADRQVIEYRVTVNDRHTLKRVEIDGNRYFDAATIRERM